MVQHEFSEFKEFDRFVLFCNGTFFANVSKWNAGTRTL